MKKALIGALIAAAALSTTSLSTWAQAPSPARVDAVVTELFGHTPEAWRAKAVQDETQKQCSQYRDEPPADVAKAITERETKNVVLPADGKFVGDWKQGEKLAQSGYGGRHTDNTKQEWGGNCYACHQLSKKEVSYGTMGPPLVEYGKIRKYAAEDAKAAYIKIYNSQAVFPCSKMPRLGHSKHLTEQQMKDIVALLFDPESPVNK